MFFFTTPKELILTKASVTDTNFKSTVFTKRTSAWTEDVNNHGLLSRACFHDISMAGEIIAHDLLDNTFAHQFFLCA